VAYERVQLSCAECGQYFSSLDIELGVRPRRWLTPSLRRKVAWLAARSSFESASEDLRELIDVEVSSSEFQREALEVGRTFERVSRREDEGWRRPVDPERAAPEPQLSPQSLVLQADATCVLTPKGEEHKSVYCGRAFGLEAKGPQGIE